jgi:hypothetical protein
MVPTRQRETPGRVRLHTGIGEPEVVEELEGIGMTDYYGVSVGRPRLSTTR